ncbi:hypothetical protein EYE40_10380 [Glaciihabitans arcticus]|uniref:Uncharacterized protein n=1 Tax=Glaciihabitans arcticus TaxID=2668039 RepID=A0A4Q9GSV2_9MICO|nr:hypothetical protein [Glaciihabitans arcticus]TBN57761.1 hypothetical protein EYE40_10380 [Glaciihabitans arcticus]
MWGQLRTVALWGAAATVIALAGCASVGSAGSIEGASDDVTLAQSKSPVQLLRNEAASRLPSIVLLDVAETTDTSVSCSDADADPDGRARSWTSGLTVHVANSRAASVPNVVSDLTDSFLEQDWTVSEEGEGSVVLANAGSAVVIELATAAREGNENATIRITTSGPCVLTDGAESDEVKALEGEL